MKCRIYIAHDVDSNNADKTISCTGSEPARVAEVCRPVSMECLTWTSSTGRKGQRAERRERTREMSARVAIG